MREQTRSSPRRSRADSVSTSSSTPSAEPAITTDYYEDSETGSLERPRIVHDNELVQFFLAAEDKLGMCMAEINCYPWVMNEPEEVKLT